MVMTVFHLVDDQTAVKEEEEERKQKEEQERKREALRNKVRTVSRMLALYRQMRYVE